MTTTTWSPSAVIAVAEPVFSNAERLALAGFLASYTGLTRAGASSGPSSTRSRTTPVHRCADAASTR
jgi:hypothetical protein